MSPIAPVMLLPIPRVRAKDLWAQWDGSLDGLFSDVTTYGGSPGGFAGAGDVFYDPALNRGLVHEGGSSGTMQMFQITSPLAAARLGDQISHVDQWNGEGAFARSDQRIWLPHRTEGSPDTMHVKLGEYDADGLTQLGGPTTNAIGLTSINSNYRSVITDLDATRAVWAFQEANIAGSPGMRVGIVQRSGGTLLTTVNNISFGVGVGSGITNMEGARPLKSDRSIVVFPTNGSAPFTFQVQGVAHAGATPSATGSATTVTTTAGGLAGFVFNRLSHCLDGLGAEKGRFVMAWRDNTTGHIQLRCIQYDGTTIALGSTLDTGIAIADFNLVTLSDGIVVLMADSDPTVDGTQGFWIIEYDEEDVDDLSLAVSALGAGQVAKDGFLAGHTALGAHAFPITRNRFGIATGNQFDESVCIKIVHNGGDSLVA